MPEPQQPTGTPENGSLVKYNAGAPVGTAGNLRSLLERNKESLGALLPKHVTTERIIKTLLVAANRNPELLLCTQSSIFETVQRSAELGLDLSGTLGEAYPVPFNNSVKVGEQWVTQKQATLIIGYRGLAKLARQTGEIGRIEAEPVYEFDHFVFEKGSNFRVEFRPLLVGDRGKLLGFFSYVRFKDGSESAEFMNVEQVEGVRKRSRTGGSSKSPWATDYNEMGRKTVFRRHSKWLPLSSERFAQALEIDNEDYNLRSEAGSTATLVATVAPAAESTAPLADEPIRVGDLAKPETPSSFALQREPEASQEPPPDLPTEPEVETQPAEVRFLPADRVKSLVKLVHELPGDMTLERIVAGLVGCPPEQVKLGSIPSYLDGDIVREIRRRGRAGAKA